jgi:hypothetical protein
MAFNCNVYGVTWTEKYTDNNGVLNIDKKMEVWSIVGDQVYRISLQIMYPNTLITYLLHKRSLAHWRLEKLNFTSCFPSTLYFRCFSSLP